MHMNRLSACREFCGVHSWQNGTRCRDGVKVLWCHSHLVWLVFEASIPTCTCFHEGKLLWLVSVAFFFLFVMLFRNGKTEERREERPRGRCMVNFFVHIKLRIIINSVKLYITLLCLWGFRAYKFPAHFMWTTIRFTEKLSVDCHHKGHIVLSRKTPLQQQFDGE